jgi:hypothetical protein
VFGAPGNKLVNAAEPPRLVAGQPLIVVSALPQNKYAQRVPQFLMRAVVSTAPAASRCSPHLPLLLLRPLLQHARSLSDRQPDARPMLDSSGEDFAGPTVTVAGIEQAIDLRSIPRPLLDFVEIAVVRVDCAVGHLVEVDVMGFGPFGMAGA